MLNIGGDQGDTRVDTVRPEAPSIRQPFRANIRCKESMPYELR